MGICEVKYEKFVEDNVDDIGRIDRANAFIENGKRLKAAINRAKATGKYAIPDRFIGYSVDSLVGKTITVEPIDGFSFENVVVKNARMLDPRFVSINDGKYKVDIANGVTADGSFHIEFGSESDVDSENTIKFKELAGTVVQNLDDYVEIVNNEDGSALSSTHKSHLDKVFSAYKTTLMNAGKDVNITVSMLRDLNDTTNTRGTANVEEGKVKLVLSNTRHRTATEVLAHEVEHVMVASAIKVAPWLRASIEELRTAMKTELSNLHNGEGYKLFLDGIENITQDDVDYAKDLWDYMFDKSTAPADEFLAFATTNERVMKSMSKIPGGAGITFMEPVKQTGAWTKIWNNIVKILSSVFNAKEFGGKMASDVAMDLLAKALDVGYTADAKAEEGRIEKILNKVNDLDQKVAKITGAIEKEQHSYVDYLTAKENDKVGNAIDAVWKIHGLARLKDWALRNNFFNSLTRNTDNKDIARFYELLRQGKAFVDKEVNTMKKSTVKVLDETYGFDKMDKGLRAAAKRVLIDTDAKVLGDASVIWSYLRNKEKVESELADIMSTLSPATKTAVTSLGMLLANNETTMHNGYTNATQIAVSIMGTVDNEVINNIDKAATLIAISSISDIDKDLAAKAIEENVNGINRVLVLKQTDENAMLKQAYRGDRMYEVKGASLQSTNHRLTHNYVDEAAMKDMVKAGFKNIGKHEALSMTLGKDMYTVIGTNLSAGYTEGLMKTVQLKSEGDSLRKILMEHNDGITEDQLDDEIEAISIADIESNSQFIPERDGKGRIYDYKLRVPRDVKMKYLGASDDIVESIAMTVSNFTLKQEAMTTNVANLQYMKKLYETYKDNKKYKFIEINEKSKGKEKEYWDIIPFYLKNEIKKSTGGSIFVEQSMLVDYFGYKDVNITELPWVKNKTKRKIVAKWINDVVMEMIKAWKMHNVALSVGTIKGNMFSNMLVALQHTKNKNPVVYMQQYKKIWGFMNDYHNDNNKLAALRVRKTAGEVIDDRLIIGLEKKLENNMVHAIMKDGQYSSMVEDVALGYFNKEGIIEGKVNAMLNSVKKEKSREKLKSLVDTIYVREGARFHDSVMKLTLYSDAINKVIILNDMAENTKEKVITQSMLNYVDGLHVNYTYLDNRYIKLANDLGFLVFTKYFFRVAPAILRMAQRKAFTMFLVEGGQGLTGIDFETPVDPFVHPLNSLLRKASLWSDPVDVMIDVARPFHI